MFMLVLTKTLLKLCFYNKMSVVQLDRVLLEDVQGQNRRLAVPEIKLKLAIATGGVGGKSGMRKGMRKEALIGVLDAYDVRTSYALALDLKVSGFLDLARKLRVEDKASRPDLLALYHVRDRTRDYTARVARLAAAIPVGTWVVIARPAKNGQPAKKDICQVIGCRGTDSLLLHVVDPARAGKTNITGYNVEPGFADRSRR